METITLLESKIAIAFSWVPKITEMLQMPLIPFLRKNSRKIISQLKYSKSIELPTAECSDDGP